MTTPEHEDVQDETTPAQAGSGANAEEVDSVDSAEAVEQAPEEPAEEAVEPEEEKPRYYVSFQRLEQLKRSPVVLLAARRVETCPSLSQPDFELTDPQALVNEIAEHYKDDEDFIRTDMPLMEIVFRILLSRKNEPTGLQELHHEVTDLWATPGAAHQRHRGRAAEDYGRR